MASLPDSEVKGDVLYLGYYQSAFNWDDETAKVTGVWGQAELQTKSPGNKGGSDLAGVFPGVWRPSRPHSPGTWSPAIPRFLREAGAVLPRGFFFSYPLHPAWRSLQASKQHRLKRYHSQTYGNGSKCDLNGRPREAEVRVRLKRRQENGPRLTV